MNSVPARGTQDRCRHCGGSGSIAIVNPAWLRWKRTSVGLTLEQAAARMAYHPVYLSSVERGQKPCSPALQQLYEGL